MCDLRDSASASAAWATSDLATTARRLRHVRALVAVAAGATAVADGGAIADGTATEGASEEGEEAPAEDAADGLATALAADAGALVAAAWVDVAASEVCTAVEAAGAAAPPLLPPLVPAPSAPPGCEHPLPVIPRLLAGVVPLYSPEYLMVAPGLGKTASWFSMVLQLFTSPAFATKGAGWSRLFRPDPPLVTVTIAQFCESLAKCTVVRDMSRDQRQPFPASIFAPASSLN
jgi:hypothetical protein